ncbi:MAG: hypothetical protein ACERKX_10805 [Anaerolineales bacterium]
MTIIPNQIARLGHEHLDEVTLMLTRSFEGDPLMDFLFPGNSTESRHALMRFSCLVRLELAWPLLGFLESGRIFGAAGITPPEDIPWPAELRHHYETLKGIIGTGAIARLERYSELTENRRPDPLPWRGWCRSRATGLRDRSCPTRSHTSDLARPSYLYRCVPRY